MTKRQVGVAALLAAGLHLSGCMAPLEQLPPEVFESPIATIPSPELDHLVTSFPTAGWVNRVVAVTVDGFGNYTVATNLTTVNVDPATTDGPLAKRLCEQAATLFDEAQKVTVQSAARVPYFTYGLPAHPNECA